MSSDTMLVPDARAGEEVLAELRRFASGNWGVTPAVSSGDPGRFAGLLGAPLLQELLRDIRVPVGMYQVLLEDGQVQPPAVTSVPMRVEGSDVIGALDPVRLRAEMRQGASLLLAGLDEYWPPVRRLCLELSRRCGLDLSALAMVTPPGGRGLHLHADKADQVVLQCEGSQHWSVGSAFSRDLVPGDALYLPRGAPHCTVAGSALSIHVTLVLVSPTLAEVAVDAARAAARQARGADSTLPPFWFEDPGAHAARLQRVAEDILVGAAAAVAGDVVAWAQRLSRQAG